MSIFMACSVEEEISQNQRINSLNKSLMCPVCPGESIDQSQNEYIYRLSFNNKKELQEFKKKIEEEKNIHKVNVNFN